MRSGQPSLKTRRAVKMAISAVAVAVALAGCGATDPAVVNTSPPEYATSPGNPLSCLGDAGLTDAEQRGPDLWRASHDELFYVVLIQDVATESVARSLVRDAVDVYAAQAGSYTVTGPARAGTAGALATSSEGAQAEAIVREVADCLS